MPQKLLIILPTKPYALPQFEAKQLWGTSTKQISMQMFSGSHY